MAELRRDLEDASIIALRVRKLAKSPVKVETALRNPFPLTMEPSKPMSRKSAQRTFATTAALLMLVTLTGCFYDVAQEQGAGNQTASAVARTLVSGGRLAMDRPKFMEGFSIV
jgi:hypothetical protein